MLYIFDKDSTIVKPVGPNGNLPASKPSEQVLYDGVAQKCDQLRNDGHILAIASNQGGVAFGLVSRENAIGMMKDAADKIGASLFALCSCHPKGEVLGAVRNSVYRKPGPGMIQYLMDALGFAPQDTVFVGDLDSDRQAAEAANVKFEWADDFFNRLEEEVVEVAEPEVDPTSTIVIEEPFPDDEDEDEDEDDDEEEGDDEEEDYWAQWEDDDDEDTDDTDDDTDDDSSDSSDDGDTDDSDSSSNSADVSGDADSGGASEAAPTSS
jgi:HAD superfamily hydrolase (TIGR01662 family)